MTQLDTLLEQVWRLLGEAARIPGAAFRTAVIATTSEEGAQLRTVVVRDFDALDHSLFCHTDTRSSKVGQLQAYARMQWLFFNPQAQLQVRVSGVTTVLSDDARTHKLWSEAPLRIRHGYLVEDAPGTPAEQRTTGLPAAMHERHPTPEESGAGLKNFAVLQCKIDFVDWLELGAFGHGRAQFRRQSDRWHGHWVVP